MSDSALTIDRDGTRVRLTLHVYASGMFHYFSFEAGSEWAAKLMVNAMRTQLSDAMTSIRREAYYDGWKHAKGKKQAKLTWFSGRLP